MNEHGRRNASLKVMMGVLALCSLQLRAAGSIPAGDNPTGTLKAAPQSAPAGASTPVSGAPGSAERVAVTHSVAATDASARAVSGRPSSAAEPTTSAAATSALPPAAAARTATADTAVLPPIKPPMTAAQVITVLDQTVDWYRTLGLQQQAANEPSDLLILYDNRQTANKVMALAFDIARADAEMLGKEPQTTEDPGSDVATSSLALLELQKKLDAQGVTLQTELDAERHPAGAKKNRIEVQAKINELQGELDLLNTKKSILSTMAGFAAGTGSSSGGALKAQIDAMAVANPSAATGGTVPSATPGAATPGSTPGAVPATQSQPLLAAASPAVGKFGLWDLAADAFRLSEKAVTITSIDQRTAALQATPAAGSHSPWSSKSRRSPPTAMRSPLQPTRPTVRR